MRFAELFNGVPDIQKLSNLGAINFGKGVTDKNIERTPHYEITRCIEMFENNSIVSSALYQLILFLIPNKKIKISSKDPKTVAFLQKWHMERKGIIEEMKNILLTNLICGNGPMEKHYAKTKLGKDVLDNIFSSNDMTRIFVNPDDLDENGVEGGDTAYVFELPVGISSFRYMGEVQKTQHIKVTYIKNYKYSFRMVHGITIPFWKFSIYQSGWSRDNLYGRANLASAIDADNIMNQILSSWDTIAKTRQIDQKIITVADTETGISVDQKVLDKLGEELEGADKSYTLFNVPLKLLQQDINLSQNYDLMENVFDMIRRLIMMSLLPQHLTPWSDSATTQGSESAMPPFLGRVKAKQNEYIKYLNEEIIDELRKTYPHIAEDASYVFDEPKILADTEYINMITSLKNEGLINTYQASLYLTRLGILDEDIINAKAPEEEGEAKEEPDDTFRQSEALSPDVGFATFAKRLKASNPVIQTTGWKELESQNVGGKPIRLIQHEKEIMLFDGLRLIDTFNTDIMSVSTIKLAFQDYKKKLIELQDEYLSGDSTEDKIIDELAGTVRKDLTDKMNNLLKMLDKSKVKKEGFSEDFMSAGVLGKVTDFFKDFTRNINSSVNKTLNKLHLNVIDDSEDNIKASEETADLLKRKTDLIKKSLQGQIKNTKDKMLQDIKGTITRGITAGKSHRDIKREVEQNFDFDREKGPAWKFDRIIRSDTRNASGLMKLKKWDSMGFEEYEWLTMEDEKVRPATPSAKKYIDKKSPWNNHRKRNRKIFKISDALKGKDIFPGGSVASGKLNINCRCRAAPY